MCGSKTERAARWERPRTMMAGTEMSLWRMGAPTQSRWKEINNFEHGELTVTAADIGGGCRAAQHRHASLLNQF